LYKTCFNVSAVLYMSRVCHQDLATDLPGVVTHSLVMKQFKIKFNSQDVISES